MWLQNLLIIMAVGGSAAYLTRQGWLAMAGRRSKLGSCCSKGCGSETTDQNPKPAEQKDAFIPLEMLGRRK